MLRKKGYDLRIVCQLFYPEMVSTGQTLTELAEELSSYGLKLKVIASQPTVLRNKEKVPKAMDYKRIRVVRTWSTRFSKLSFFGKLLNLTTFFITASFNVLLKDRKVPLLLLTNPPYLPLLGWISNMFYGTSYGVLLHDIMPEQAELLNLIKPKGVIAKIWRRINYLWYRKASYVIALSKDMVEGAIDNANLRDSKYESDSRSKTHIIHVWSDDRIIKPIDKNDSGMAKKLNVLDKFVVQYSGNHGRFHDIETLINIAANMSDENRVIFQFIGEGHKKEIIDRYKQEKHLNNVYSSTYVLKDALSDSLAMADIGVIAQMPGQERVCYPSKLLGIMSSGRPVLAICSKDCDLARMIEENELGFVISNGDVESAVKLIEQCINNPSMVSEKGKKAFDYLIKNFSLDLAAKRYYALIKANL
jgi:glycosyltransferase involved in cell wall biosynthesis